MNQSLPTVLAYYGKLPARGDFVGRRLPRETIGLWDAWLQEAIAASRRDIGARWLDHYLISPLWRFVLPAGLCGAAALAGVLMPSVDKVGRAFPLMLGAELDPALDPAAVISGGRPWFEAIEDLALAALAEDFALDRLDAPIAAHLLMPAGAGAVASMPLGAFGHCVPLAGPAEAPMPAADGAADRSFWWSTGSTQVAPALVLAHGLPAPDGFAAFINGDWAGHGWSVDPPPAEVPVASTDDAGASSASPVLEAELLPWDREE